MSERYSRLFSLPENLGQYGCPVLISAGALLKDNNTGKLLVQLKFRNISEQIIKSVKIKVNAYDTAGCELKGVEAFSYLDLAVGRDKEFGNQTPVILPDKTTRSFSVEILSVAFMDGTAYIPSIHIAADTLDRETLKTVQLLDDKRRERKEKQLAIQKEGHLRLHHISHLPLIINVLPILLNVLYLILISGTYSGYASTGDMTFLQYIWLRFGKALLVSLIVPCLSILCYRKAEHKPILIIIAAGITGFFLIIQITQALFDTGIIPVKYYYYYGRFGSSFYRYIDGCDFDYALHCLRAGDYAIALILLSANVLFVVKNIIGFVALYLQAKNAKK